MLVFNNLLNKNLKKVKPHFLYVPLILSLAKGMATDLQPLWNGFSYKPHQISGVKWMLNRESNEKSGGLLCDEMGLGKTMEVLGVMINNKVQNSK